MKRIYMFSAIFCLTLIVCCVSFADDSALRNLKEVTVTINVPEDSGPLAFQLKNSIELKLRQAGLKISSKASSEIRLNVVWVDLDPAQKEILGKYGTVQLSLHEPVKLLRDMKVTISARTWEGMIAMLHGPPDSFAERTRQWSSDLTEDFLNNWMKAREL